ncbi:MAG: polysaccharide deacetylase family protein [Chloroflexi bacterium OHK40]
MIPRSVLLGATLACLLVGAFGAWLFLQQRLARCAYVPLLAEQLLPNAALASGAARGLPDGWERAAAGVELRGPAVDGEGFDLDGDGRALQLLGIANYAQAPAAPALPGTRYCFTAFALTDSTLRSPTRARLIFLWRDAQGAALGEDATAWQPVRLWTPERPPRDWSPLAGSFVAPPGAASLAVRVEPASDDRIYLDLPALRRGGAALTSLATPQRATPAELPRAANWPLGRQAAVAFTFDWETSMGGLVHSRSVGDPNATEDHVLRGLRMREGITTTLALFEPLGLRATYYATGYNFLFGNQERRRFMGDPTFTWATRANGWTSDRWASTPWFADDPYGTVVSDPAWYFGDLIAPLRAAGHEVQSHSFSHLYGGLSDAATWQLDLQAWNELAAEHGVPPATSLAFPWSSSGGMSDAAWDALEAAGITSVTRLSDQAQYRLFPADADGVVTAPRCRDLPGREGRILACPDFYLTADRVSLALRQIESAVAAGGMIDLWAHTEEVTTAEQVAAWRQVAERVAADERLWVAPLAEITAWQQALAQLRIEPGAPGGPGEPATFTIATPARQNLVGLALELPSGTNRVQVSGDDLPQREGPVPSGVGWWPRAGLAVIDLAAGQTVEVQVWQAP